MATATPKRDLDLSSLAAEARAACARGQVERARIALERLEKQDPEEPEWSRRLANLHRQGGRPKDELDALVRCADRQSAREEFRSAISTYEMILNIEPDHRLAQERLSRLQPNRTVSVHYVDGPLPGGSAVGRETTAPLRLADSPSRDPELATPLDVLVLSSLVPGSRPAAFAETNPAELREIPLEPCDVEPPSSPDGTDPSPALGDLDADMHQRANALRRLRPFCALGGSAIAELAERARWLQPRAGEPLVRQGDPAGGLYVVVQGAVVPIDEGESRVRLAVLEAGDFFGEVPLFTQRPHGTTVEALVDSHVLCLDRGAIWSLLQDDTGLLLRLLRALRERMVHGLVQTSPLFQIFSATKLSAIARRFRLLEAEAGCALVEQGRACEAVFMLLAGRSDLVHGGAADPSSSAVSREKALATLEPGELFGEMSLLWQEPSQASLITRSRCWLLALPARGFQEILEHHPELAVRASRIARARRNHLLSLSDLPADPGTRSD